MCARGRGVAATCTSRPPSHRVLGGRLPACLAPCRVSDGRGSDSLARRREDLLLVVAVLRRHHLERLLRLEQEPLPPQAQRSAALQPTRTQRRGGSRVRLRAAPCRCRPAGQSWSTGAARSCGPTCRRPPGSAPAPLPGQAVWGAARRGAVRRGAMRGGAGAARVRASAVRESEGPWHLEVDHVAPDFFSGSLLRSLISPSHQPTPSVSCSFGGGAPTLKPSGRLGSSSSSSLSSSSSPSPSPSSSSSSSSLSSSSLLSSFFAFLLLRSFFSFFSFGSRSRLAFGVGCGRDGGGWVAAGGGGAEGRRVRCGAVRTFGSMEKGTADPDDDDDAAGRPTTSVRITINQDRHAQRAGIEYSK